MAEKLRVDDLRISFWTSDGFVRAVRGVDFSIQEGESLAIVGESGSGKSVTAKAIMGILAGNARVDHGKILYNGMDLLKIPEETFHTLRGNNVSMIFQDPLSSLNPIVRIGKQIVEAMMANNKMRRRQAENNYKEISKYLVEFYAEALMEEGKSAEEANHIAKKEMNQFFDLLKSTGKLSKSYNSAYESGRILKDHLSDAKIQLLHGTLDKYKTSAKEIARLSKTESDALFFDWRKEFAETFDQIQVMKQAKDFDQNEAKQSLGAKIDQLLERLDQRLNQETPDFLALTYAKENADFDFGSTPEIHELNERAQAKFKDNYEHLIHIVAQALKTSAKQSNEKKSFAVAELRRALKELEGEFTVAQASQVIDSLKKSIPAAINHLNLSKNSFAYTFVSSAKDVIRQMKSYIHLEQKSNPKAKASFIRKKRLSDELNMATCREMLRDLLDETAKSFEEQIATKPSSYENLAHDVIARISEWVETRDFPLTRTVAKERAIRIMDEVGIPEPRRRFRQFPFEFSGGMRQRIVIAIALSSNPDILICDEPTTALDVTIQAQIIDLIKDLKERRNLTVIFITHDLGVVANIADRIAVMYAGKIVEKGLSEEIFYDPRHPYTWALLASMPDLATKEKLESIPGTPPDMIHPPVGDAFAARNKHALKIDFEQEPPLFKITDTHYAATWLLHEYAPKVDPPAIVTDRIKRMTGEDYGSVRLHEVSHEATLKAALSQGATVDAELLAGQEQRQKEEKSEGGQA